MHQHDEYHGDTRGLDRTPTQCVHKKTSQTRTLIRDAIAKRRNHSLLEAERRLGTFQGRLQNFVGELLFLVQQTALSAFHQMGMQFFAFGFAQLAVQVGREKFVNVIVNRDHRVQEKTSVLVLRRFRIAASARPRIPRNAPLLSPRVRSIVA